MRPAIDGQDYLTDHYAVLNVPRDASAAAITSAYRKMSKENHPDLLEGRSAEIRAAGRQAFQAADRAYEILSKPERRADYDAQLAAWTGPLIASGHEAVVAGGSSRVMDLVSERGRQALAADLEQATRMAPDRADLVDLLQGQYDANPNPPEQLRAALRAMLEAHDVFLHTQAATRANAVGISIWEPPAGELVAATRAALSSVRTDLTEVLSSGRITRLALEGAVSTEPVTPILVTDGFDEQARIIEELAQQRVEMQKRRLALIDEKYVARAPGETVSQHLAVGFDTEIGSQFFVFDMDADGTVTGNRVFTLAAADDIAAWVQQGFDVVVTQRQELLPAEA